MLDQPIDLTAFNETRLGPSVTDGQVKMCGYEIIIIIIIKQIFHLFIVASVYNPPDSSSKCFESFEYLIKAVDDEKKELKPNKNYIIV